MRKILLVLCVFIVLITTSFDVDARSKKRAKQTDFTKSSRYASLVVNADSGDVVYSRSANKLRYPASLTKMMTLYLTFQALEEGRLYYYQKIPVSKKASRQPRTKLWLKKGQTITVRDAIMSLIIRSANDAAVVLAEAVDGTEAKFAQRMTRTAHQLGMKNTTFKNASGLPNKHQKTTAYDMAKLGIALKRDFPKYFPLFSKTSFKFKGKIIASHNRVLTRYKWADGLKTGYTNASGYNLVTSTNHPNAKLVGVVLGGPSSSVRDNHMIQILDYGMKLVAKSKVKQRARLNKSNPTIFKFVDKQKLKEKVIMTAEEKEHQSKIKTGVFDAVGISKLIKDSPKVFNVSNAFEYVEKVNENSEEMEFSGQVDPIKDETVFSNSQTEKKHKKVIQNIQKETAQAKLKAKKKVAPKKAKKAKLVNGSNKKSISKKPKKVTKVTPKPKTKSKSKSKSAKSAKSSKKKKT